MEKTREEIAIDILASCTFEALADHEVIAAAIERGDSKDAILNMPEVDRWPETYVWLKGVL